MESEVKYEYINPYEPLPWQVEPFHDFSPILLLSGSAGGGKSKLAAEKIHSFCLRYPGATGLILRKVRATMANSTILVIKGDVIGRDPRVRHRPSEFRFDYENGSILAYGGMKDDDQRERIRSIGQKGGIDICWMEEATEFTEEDFNEVLARMRGNAAPWRQIILSTNPDGPGHWINMRLILGGEASVYYSGALDNPYNPDDYHETLKGLSGVQYRRLVLGEWAAGSGRVYDTWVDEFNKVTGKDNGGNVTLDAEYIPDGGPVVWAVDDGYAGKFDKRTEMFTGKSHPRAVMLCQLRHDGQLAIFAESLKIETLATQHIQDVLRLSERNSWPRPIYAVRDRAAAALEGALDHFHIRSRINQMTVDESVKQLREWMAPDLNGVRQVIAHPRCRHLRYEVMTHSFNADGKVIKEFDNALDALRYLVWDLSYGRPATVDIATYSSVAG